MLSPTLQPRELQRGPQYQALQPSMEPPGLASDSPLFIDKRLRFVGACLPSVSTLGHTPWVQQGLF